MQRGSVRIIAAALAAACSAEPPAAEPSPGELEIAVRVDGVVIDGHAFPVVLLKEADGPRLLPIWIGTAEATSIARHIDASPAPRPNTHDLAARLIERLDARVDRMVVTALRDGTYYGVLHLRSGNGISEMDVRPSDGIAIALRSGAPIFVNARLLEAAGETPAEEPAKRPDPQRRREEIDPATPGRTV
ncbi:MAG: bifunctional nuclease family protein [Deltaproteobacteria bacterium]|nr:bifunctional nuclease family protein [Deltaproteobacteria bacterium]MBW2362545.1 bifunctional nuclease family protein [Deltaproteobacteria bacterium]